MKRTFCLLFFVLLLGQVSTLAQGLRDDAGFELGTLRFQPEVAALSAYDNRVAIDDTTGDTSDDVYSEVTATLHLKNKPARYNLTASGGVGYRSYRDFSELDGDFYNAGASIVSDDDPLMLGLSAYVEKSLDYDTFHDASAEQEPSAILTADESTRYSVRARVAYEETLTDRTSITPGYDAWYYFQDFETADDAEWLSHRASLRITYAYTRKTEVFVEGYYTHQITDMEDGNVGAVVLGAFGEATDKTRWSAQAGVAAADYEESGSAVGVVGEVRINWDVTDKIVAYVFGASEFEPGYNGGSARQVYRLGYGADWQVATRWTLVGQVLHDYDQNIGNSSTTDYGDANHFAVARVEYAVTKPLDATAGVRFIADDEKTDQTVVTLGATYRF